MRKIGILAAALGAVLLAAPAAAGQEDVTRTTANAQMPFPALMNALTGGGRQAATGRHVPQPRFAQPHGRASRTAVAPGRTAPRATVDAPRRAAPQGRPTRVAAVASPARQIDPRYLPAVVDYDRGHKPGTIVIDTNARYLYLVEAGGKARRYGVGVGRPGFEWAGTHKVTRKAEWPGWTPPAEMRKRQPGLPKHMKGGPNNPLGARALYLGSTLYRIHGSNEPWSIGRAVSSGCIRMRNEDVKDLYERVRVGTKVIVS